MEIDRTGASLTPEQASKAMEKVEVQEETQEVVAPVEESKETSPEPAENKEPEAEPKTPEPLQEKRSIYTDYKEKKEEVKEAKEEIKALKAEKEALISEKSKLEELANQLKEAKKPEEKAEIADDIKEFAESIGADPDAIGKLESFLKKRMTTVESTISKEDVELIKQLKSEKSKIAEQVGFQKEWNEFVPSLKKDFPNISDKELVTIQKEMDKLAHTKGLNDKELDYIYFKQKEAISKLVSPKRNSFESSGNTTHSNEVTPISLSSKSSPMDVQNFAQNDRRSPSQLTIKKGHNK